MASGEVTVAVGDGDIVEVAVGVGVRIPVAVGEGWTVAVGLGAGVLEGVTGVGVSSGDRYKNLTVSAITTV